MKSKKEQEVSAIVAATDAEIKEAENDVSFDLSILSQCSAPDNMAIPLDADVTPETYCRWTRKSNIDARRRRQWRTIHYKANCEESGPVKMDDLVLMGRPKKLQDAYVEDLKKKNVISQKVEDRVNQIDKDITILPGGPG